MSTRTVQTDDPLKVTWKIGLCLMPTDGWRQLKSSFFFDIITIIRGICVSEERGNPVGHIFNRTKWRTFHIHFQMHFLGRKRVFSIQINFVPRHPHGKKYPDSKVHGDNMGPIWGRQDPGGPHIGPMKFAFWVSIGLAMASRELTIYHNLNQWWPTSAMPHVYMQYRHLSLCFEKHLHYTFLVIIINHHIL